MPTSLLRPLAAALTSIIAFCLPAIAQASDGIRLSGPVQHENLAIYFVRGSADKGATPLTLQEALAKGRVKVHETGNVSELSIENLGDQEVFVQAGDMVKGGQQDRVLSVSLVLPPKSGRVAISSFCVESGRWAARGKENVKEFASAGSALPSRHAKMAMRQVVTAAPQPVAAAEPAPSRLVEDRGERGQRRTLPHVPSTPSRQQQMWDNVRAMQDKLSRNIGSAAVSPASPTSLQLTLESEKLRDAQAAYLKALQSAGEGDADIVGYVFAINGKINSAEIYPANTLFRKMWPKLLTANVIEAIADKSADASASAPPPAAEVTAFLMAAERGTESKKPLPMNVSLATRDSDTAFFSETRRADGSWVHRNYLAK